MSLLLTIKHFKKNTNSKLGLQHSNIILFVLRSRERQKHYTHTDPSVFILGSWWPPSACSGTRRKAETLYLVKPQAYSLKEVDNLPPAAVEPREGQKYKPFRPQVYSLKEVGDLPPATVGPGDRCDLHTEVRGHHMRCVPVLAPAPIVRTVVFHAETEGGEEKYIEIRRNLCLQKFNDTLGVPLFLTPYIILC